MLVIVYLRPHRQRFGNEVDRKSPGSFVPLRCFVPISHVVRHDPNQAIPLSATITGASAQHVTGEMLSAPAMDAHNTFEEPYAVYSTPFTGASVNGGVLSLTLPAKSIVVLSLQ